MVVVYPESTQTDTVVRLHAAGGEDVDGSELSGAESGRVTGFCV